MASGGAGGRLFRPRRESQQQPGQPLLGIRAEENIVGRPFVIYFSVRGISPLDPTPLPGDKFSHGSSLLSALLDFARWDRMFQIVR